MNKDEVNQYERIAAEVYAEAFDSRRKPALWTDPWDGKQKVMERRQPRARADLLPPGVTAGVDGKWTYVPEVKLDQGRIRAAAAGQGSINVDAGAVTQASTPKATVGCLVRIKNEVSDPWNGLIVKVERVEPNDKIYGSVEDCSASSLFKTEHFRTHKNNHDWFFESGHYDLIEAAVGALP